MVYLIRIGWYFVVVKDECLKIFIVMFNRNLTFNLGYPIAQTSAILIDTNFYDFIEIFYVTRVI